MLLKTYPILALLAAMTVCPGLANAQSVSGPARAVDGDTLAMTGVRVRLFGIDAPEASQTCQRGAGTWACGQEATQQLAQLVAGKQVRCERRDTDVYGRMVAICVAGNLDLGQTMVEAGLATAFTKYSTRYVEAEARARQHKIGIWGSVFETPSAYRAAHPRKTPPPDRAAQPTAPSARSQQAYRNQFGCAIKGNRNRKGQWIYHLPGMPYYDRTRPEELFCTEAEAQAAGYRRAIVR
jgi:endonuclease YncB( thermonuclease family)